MFNYYVTLRSCKERRMYIGHIPNSYNPAKQNTHFNTVYVKARPRGSLHSWRVQLVVAQCMAVQQLTGYALKQKLISHFIAHIYSLIAKCASHKKDNSSRCLNVLLFMCDSRITSHDICWKNASNNAQF